MRSPELHVFAILALLLSVACGSGERPTGSGTADGAEREASVAEGPLVVFLGDSLTAGYGLDEEAAFPALIEARARNEGRPLRAINGGVSGDTSAGGLARLDWFLRQDPAVLVVGLGGNDGLRGLPLEQLESNLRAIVERARERGVAVLLLGQRIPPSLGLAYSRDFAELYGRLADELDVELVPFLLEGVGGVRRLNLPDGLHPNEEGHEILADTVWKQLDDVLGRLE